MNCRNLWLWRKAVCFGLAENQEKRVSAAHRRFGGIVKLRVGVTVFSQLLHTLRRARAQIIEAFDRKFGGDPSTRQLDSGGARIPRDSPWTILSADQEYIGDRSDSRRLS